MNPGENSVLAVLKGGLIVSCQASKGEPLCKPEIIGALCQSALSGGARALRLEGLENISYVKKLTKYSNAPANVPIIGITKTEDLTKDQMLDQVYITSTLVEAISVARAGADIVALDATARPRPDNLSLAQTIEKIHKETSALVWADTATIEEARQAQEAGCDIVSTTLYGYTRQTQLPSDAEPSFEFLEQCIKELKVPVILEGRVWHPAEVERAIKLGAHAVVVGSAITRPHLITERFVNATK
ncbi:MAG: N-acetylmannosamine-6-phosphate 2-epimerase [Candidatus Melainabacteria bacterium]|nr:MAG: N-acetylmannosamine-6-phosphate 2-epimerase [Candidatus Melainabacteria bacterium]